MRSNAVKLSLFLVVPAAALAVTARDGFMAVTPEEYSHMCASSAFLGGLLPIGLTITELRLIFQYSTIISVSVLYYDWALTVGRERMRYWTKPVTLPAAFFLANRYLALLQQPAFVAEIFAANWSYEVRTFLTGVYDRC